MKQKLFTKSAFKIAINCQTQLYYSYKRVEYANQELEDDFLQSLAGYNDLIVRVGFLDIHSANRNSMTVQ